MAKIISFSCPEWVEKEIISKQKKRSEWLTQLIIKSHYKKGLKFLQYNLNNLSSFLKLTEIPEAIA